MESIVEYNLKEEEIFSDKFEYLYMFLSDRFEYLNELWINVLEQKFNQKFKPIWILSAKQNKYFEKENFIVINKKLKQLKENLKNNSIIYLQDYEDLNKEFSESQFISRITNQLIEKQGRVFIISFTSSGFQIHNPNVIILGPKPEIAAKYDNKIEQIKLFEQLNVPRNKTRIYDSILEIKENEKYPFFISAAYTSGGHESKAIFTEEDLDHFYTHLREINKSNQFLVANLIQDIILSPNVNAIIIDENRTEIICISDQILRGNQYLGNIYPSKANEQSKKIIVETTKIIGKYLASEGFKGLFGLDFIIDSRNNTFVVDLNPRRQGGYLCNTLMSKKVNIIELELKLALGERLPTFDYNDFQLPFAWAHSKIKPYYKNMKIKDSYRWGNYNLPFEQKGSMFKCIFYPENYLLMEGTGGYLIISGNDHEEVKKRIIKETEVAISTDFELYEGLQ